MVSMNLPIHFYGRIVDQNMAPVPGVRVVFRVRQPRFDAQEIAGAHFDTGQAMTDPNGAFQISGETGDVLIFETIEKEGYLLADSFQREWNYAGASVLSPNSADPVIVRMWHFAEPQILQHHRLSRVGIPCDGHEVNIDLLSGAKVAQGGHLQVRFWREPKLLSNDRTKYDWKLALTVVSGGLVPASGDFLFAAPAEGYSESWQVDMPAAKTNWVSKFEQAFYVKLNNGSRFGLVRLALSTHYNPPPVGLTLEIAVNPTGSRNLETK